MSIKTASTDIIVTNKISGEVGVLRNLGHGAFAPAVLYRAGGGLYGVTNNTDGSATLTTLEATSGVAAGAFTRGGPPDLVAIDPGSNTFSLLAGLGAGRFANPVAFPTARSRPGRPRGRLQSRRRSRTWPSSAPTR